MAKHTNKPLLAWLLISVQYTWNTCCSTFRPHLLWFISTLRDFALKPSFTQSLYYSHNWSVQDVPFRGPFHRFWMYLLSTYYIPHKLHKCVISLFCSVSVYSCHWLSYHPTKMLHHLLVMVPAILFLATTADAWCTTAGGVGEHSKHCPSSVGKIQVQA